MYQSYLLEVSLVSSEFISKVITFKIINYNTKNNIDLTCISPLLIKFLPEKMSIFIFMHDYLRCALRKLHCWYMYLPSKVYKRTPTSKTLIHTMLIVNTFWVQNLLWYSIGTSNMTLLVVNKILHNKINALSVCLSVC